MTACHNAAVEYAALHGLPVIPVARSKAPLTEHGCKSGTTNLDVIDEWWYRWPTANVAIVTDPQLIVLDVDGVEGHATLDQLEREHGQLAGPRAATGSGGLHLYFRQTTPPLHSRTRFAPGLDVKALGGFIIAPPSVHACGNRYTWISDLYAPWHEPPAWLATMMRPAADPLPPRPPVRVRPRSARWVKRLIDAQVHRVANAPIGERNDTLYMATFAIAAELGRRDPVVLDDVLALLLGAALHAGVPEREACATIKSAVGKATKVSA